MRTQSNKLNFEGENIYVGIDVHLKSWNVTIYTEYLHHKTFNQPPVPSILRDYLNTNFPGGTYYSAYEAGFCGFNIHFELKKLNINNIVVNPADIPTSQKEQVLKNDSRDSMKIARSLRANELIGIHVPFIETLENRTLMRTRDVMVKDMTRFKQRIKALLYFYGISYPPEFEKSTSHWSRRFLKWLKEEVSLNTANGNDALSLLIREVEQQRVLLLEINRKIHSLAVSEKYVKEIELIRSIPGIGLVTGLTFLSEIEDIERFPNTDKLAGFVGLIPTCHSSGEMENYGEMTFRKKTTLRRWLIESAWVAVRIDPALTRCFSQLCKRMEPNKAIIRIARKLLNRMYYVLKKRQKYECGVV
jgi:transposase